MLPRSWEGAASFVFAFRPQRCLKVGFGLGHLRRVDGGYREHPTTENTVPRTCKLHELATDMLMEVAGRNRLWILFFWGLENARNGSGPQTSLEVIAQAMFGI